MERVHFCGCWGAGGERVCEYEGLERRFQDFEVKPVGRKANDISGDDFRVQPVGRKGNMMSTAEGAKKDGQEKV
uniref:Uncharacterized protein n=1 Tax=Pristionchus pacificus TaxID=54126 RepID=A0A2A6CHU9_PRIPA|eukprot:PDM77804.1 hypothetical protein PRIPAC_34671 [Pristionchus pacificus]